MKTQVYLIDVKIPTDLTDFEGEVYADVVEWIEELAVDEPEYALELLQGPFKNAVEAYWAEVFGEDDVLEDEELSNGAEQGCFCGLLSGIFDIVEELSAMYDAVEYVMQELTAEIIQLNFEYDLTELALDAAIADGDTEVAAKLQVELDRIVDDYLATEQELINRRNNALNISRRDRDRRQAKARQDDIQGNISDGKAA